MARPCIAPGTGRPGWLRLNHSTAKTKGEDASREYPMRLQLLSFLLLKRQSTRQETPSLRSVNPICKPRRKLHCKSKTSRQALENEDSPQWAVLRQSLAFVHFEILTLRSEDATNNPGGGTSRGGPWPGTANEPHTTALRSGDSANAETGMTNHSS